MLHFHALRVECPLYTLNMLSIINYNVMNDVLIIIHQQLIMKRYMYND